MSSKMLQFVRLGKAMPDKREAADRCHDFREIYEDFEPASAAAQAGRCSQCGVPFCQVHCPVHNNIPDWLKLTAEGRLEEAYEMAAATNNFPEICGRICPQDRLCEGNCVIEQAGHYANNWMMAKYDQLNPPAMKKLLAGGTKLHTFSPPIMQASLKATKELYAETAATNPNFKKILESMNTFTSNGYQWFQVAELGYDSFMARNPQG